jgi:hypothetical protein
MMVMRGISTAFFFYFSRVYLAQWHGIGGEELG